MALSMNAHRKKDAIAELVTMLHEAGKIGDVNNLLNELLAREEAVSTGIGQGVAIPHYMGIHGPDDTYIVFGRKQEGIPFDALDNKPVTLFFLIAGPEGKKSNHLQLLCKLARILRDPQLRKNLHEAQKPDDIINVIKQQEEE